MKVGYINNGYPEKRCIINKCRSKNIEYKFINRKYSDPYFIIRKIRDNFFKHDLNINWDESSVYKPLLSPDVDIIHTFNTVCDANIKWCATFESTIPRTNNTVSRTWEYPLHRVYSPDKLTRKELEILQSDNCIALFALSDSAYKIQKYFIEKTDFHDLLQKIHILHPPQRTLIEEKQIEKKFSKMKTLHFVFVGNDFFRKGGSVAVDAFDKIADKHPNFHLTVISRLMLGVYANKGTSIDLDQYKLILKNRPWITWYDGLPNEDVLRILVNSHVGLLPTFADTYGYSVLEMQAAGCPVITTNIRALPELNSNECGWICNLPIDNIGGELLNLTDKQSIEKNKSILSMQLDNILKDIISRPETLYDKGLKSYRRIEEFHDPVKYGEKLKKIYSQK